MSSGATAVTPSNAKIPSRLSTIASRSEFEQNDGSQQFALANSIPVQRRDQQQHALPPSRLADSPLAILTFCPIKDSISRYFPERDESAPADADDEQASTPISDSTSLVLTSNRAQQTSPTDMFPIVNDTSANRQVAQWDDDPPSKPNDLSPTSVNGGDDDDSSRIVRSPPPTQRAKHVPKSKYAESHPSPHNRNGKSPGYRWNSPANAVRAYPVVPSIMRRSVQGILVHFFRVGEPHHRGLQLAVNDADLKSWEALLNYLNRQPNLALQGGIKHIYSLTGEEIYRISQFQHHQCYVVSPGAFIATNYHWANESFVDDLDSNVQSSFRQGASPYVTTRASVNPRWRSPAAPQSSMSASSSVSITNGERVFLLPYSKLNLYESVILNRNSIQTFDEWLDDQVSDLLAQHTNNEKVTHLFAVLSATFVEVKSFSKLFGMLKKTDTFIGCTDEEYVHAKDYLEMMKPDELFVDRKGSRQGNGTERHRLPSKRAIADVQASITWIHGYNGDNELTKKLYTLPENEILYVIDSICVLYETNLRQQRFYTRHKHSITCVNVHRSQPLVASSEKSASKNNNQRASIHIWDHVKLETISAIHKEQFGSAISLLSFSPKADDDLLLVISRDKPKIVLFIDWKRSELIYSITCKSDNILSVLFVFDTTEWIACISQRHLLFYHVNWSTRPLRMLERRESEVQNVYTGAAACDLSGERLLVGDEVGNVYVWGLMDKEPKLIVVQENVLENDVDLIVPVSQEMFLLANRQNQIKIWNVKKDTVEQIRLNENIGPIQSACCIQRRSVSVALAIGTKSNYIISKEIGKEQFHVLMRGHMNPSTCICYSRDSHFFFSISSDRQIFKWNAGTKSVEWATKSNQPISCADLHPQRNVIVLGTETGKLILYDTLSSFYIAAIALKSNTGVKSVRFSPDGRVLAVGLQNGNVCIYDVVGNGDFHQREGGILRNDTAAVSTVIWSSDGRYLLSIYSDNDYNIWTIPSFEINRSRSIQNIDWDRIMHPLMSDILDKSVTDTHSSAVILSSTLVLCCGKDGQLRLFRTRYARNSQTFQFGLGAVQSIVPSPDNSAYLLSLVHNPAIVEIQLAPNSPV